MLILVSRHSMNFLYCILVSLVAGVVAQHCRISDFTWDAGQSKIPKWYSISNIHSDAPIRRYDSVTINGKRRIFSIDEKYGTMLQKTLTYWFRNQTFKSSIDPRDYHSSFRLFNGTRLATFRNSTSLKDGIVLDPMDCSRQFRNGGCFTNHGVRSHTVEHHDVVVNIGSIIYGTWHFPMEILVGLRNVPPHMLSKAIIQVPSRSDYIMQWMKLIPGVNISNVRDTYAIHAQTVLLPELGGCGNPAPAHLDWLDHAVSGLTSSSAPTNRSIILVERSHSRGVVNHEEVYRLVKSFANDHGFEFVHQDDHKLPPISEQITRFRKASIVVMPHGAGGLFINFSPEGTCVIEFQQDYYVNVCFGQLAYYRNLNYIGRMMVNSTIIGSDLLESLKQCLDVI